MSTTAATEVDAAVWFAVAGATVKIPSINSFVYYFPQGHFENTFGNRIQIPGAPNIDYIPCRVLSVQFLCSNPSDQVFAKIRLQRAKVYGNNNHNTHDGLRQQQSQNRNDDVDSFVKILSIADVMYDSFRIPKLCADTILPPLDSPAGQNLTIKDTLNKEWAFFHNCYFRRMHFLITGWGEFVEAKRVKTGDSVVFMRKKSTNELFLGIRRAAAGRSGGGGLVVAAIDSALKGEAFEVSYYPRFGSRNFVVEAEKVEAAMRVGWRVGMKVRMAGEKKDVSGVAWSQATVKAVLSPHSPWRILEVNCDLSGTMHRVNPWEVIPSFTVNSIRLFGTTIHISSDPIQPNSEQQEENDQLQLNM